MAYYYSLRGWLETEPNNLPQIIDLIETMKRNYQEQEQTIKKIMLRSNIKRDVFAWKRGETTASAGQLMAFNGLTAEALSKRAEELLG